MTTYYPRRALQLLRAGSGNPHTTFRDGQEDAIRHVVEGRGRLLVVQKTGWGKSFVYFIATKLLREAGLGPALLVSPLLSLMRNQISAAQRMGVRAMTINSSNENDWPDVAAAVERDEVDILLIAPERLGNESFGTKVLGPIAHRISLLVVDEAHCISDWGHDFRPHYRRLERIIRGLPPKLRVLATTATANNRVMEDLEAVLGPDLHVVRGDLNRPSLTLQTIRLPNAAQRLAWLADQLPRMNGSGIIYTLTKRSADLVTKWLKSRGLNVEAYTADVPDRPALEQSLLENRVKALVATTSLGMGYDKPDLVFVVHFQAPGSVVAYYQQVGRAGRALPAAYGVLLSGEEEDEINEHFIESAFPTPEEVDAVLTALRQEPAGLSSTELLGRVNLSKARIDKTLDLLSLESPPPMTKTGSKWQLTAAPLTPAFWERAARLTNLRRAEQQQMQQYVALPADHMAFLIRALDGDPSKVTPPTLPPLLSAPPPGLVQDAVAFLRRTNLPIEPRRQWPQSVGMPRYELRGKIPEHLQAQEGRALSVWGDAGWGGFVRKGKYTDRRFVDELVTACADLVRTWNPQPAPKWVTCIPSLRHPNLVPDFAARLAAALGLAFHPVLVKTDHRPEQKSRANSTQQALNVDGSLALTANALPDVPVLLVDDMVDSKWTLTVAAWLMRSAGCGPVWPLALAVTGPGE
jgi:ATP-dependent DNA helicase RecQ